MRRSEQIQSDQTEISPPSRRRATLGLLAAGVALGVGGTLLVNTVRSNPLEQSTAIAVGPGIARMPDGIPIGATITVDFSVPEAVEVSDAIHNIQTRFYEDSSVHDAIVNFEIPEGYYVYKVQCDSGDLSDDTLIQSSTFVCDFPIYEDSFRPATD